MTMVPSCLSPMGERAAEQVSERWRVAGIQHGLCGWQGCPLLDWSGQLLSWSSRALLDLVHRPRPPALDLEKFPPDFGAQQWNPGAWLGVGHPVCTLRGWGGILSREEPHDLALAPSASLDLMPWFQGRRSPRGTARPLWAPHARGPQAESRQCTGHGHQALPTCRGVPGAGMLLHPLCQHRLRLDAGRGRLGRDNDGHGVGPATGPHWLREILPYLVCVCV